MRKFAAVLNAHELNRWTYSGASVSFGSISLINGYKPKRHPNGHVSLKNMIKRAFSFWSKEIKSNITNQGTDNFPVKNYNIISPIHKKPPNQQISMPSYINRPEYANSSEAFTPSIDDPLKIWNEDEIRCIRMSCQLAKRVLRSLADIIFCYGEGSFGRQCTESTKYANLGQPSILTTDELNRKAQEMIISNKAYPSTLNFKGFPKSIATSVNNVAAHGIPDDRPLELGDILTIDVTVFHDGFHGDCSETYVFGGVCDPDACHLISSAKECLFGGIAACAPGAPLRSIGSAISKISKRRGLTVVPPLCGHGIGTFFHMAPDIYHCVNNYPGVMKPGMIFTIEPCITEGFPGVDVWSDGFSIATRDHSRTAQFEHTVLITEKGVDILTL